MPRPPKTHTPPAPAFLRVDDVAARLGRSTSWFRQNRLALEAEGFPARDRLIKGWAAAAIEAWIARRGGTSVEPSPWLERLRHVDLATKARPPRQGR